MTTLSLQHSATIFSKRFLPIFVAGMIGVVSFIVASVASITQQLAAIPELAALPLPVQLLVAAISPTMLVAIFSAVGAVCAPRLGLRSRITEHFVSGTPFFAGLRPELPTALVTGLMCGIGLVAYDVATRAFLPPMKAGAEQFVEAVSHTTLASIVATMLYGGITEEVLIRWGLMSLFAWIGWKLTQRDTNPPRPPIMWTAISLAALVFGIGHLGAAAVVYELTPFVIVRTVAGNAIFGMIFGWLFWRRSLEAAMIAHASSHLTLTVIIALVGLFAN